MTIIEWIGIIGVMFYGLHTFVGMYDNRSKTYVPRIITLKHGVSKGKQFDLNKAKKVLEYGKDGNNFSMYLTGDSNWVWYRHWDESWGDHDDGIEESIVTAKTRLITHKGELFASKYFPEILDFKATI